MAKSYIFSIIYAYNLCLRRIRFLLLPLLFPTRTTRPSLIHLFWYYYSMSQWNSQCHTINGIGRDMMSFTKHFFMNPIFLTRNFYFKVSFNSFLRFSAQVHICLAFLQPNHLLRYAVTFKSRNFVSVYYKIKLCLKKNCNLDRLVGRSNIFGKYFYYYFLILGVAFIVRS